MNTSCICSVMRFRFDTFMIKRAVMENDGRFLLRVIKRAEIEKGLSFSQYVIKRATRENDGRFLQHMVNSTTKHKDIYTGKYWSKILGGAYVN